VARQRAAVQINQFIGGMNTEANPLSFPENSSIDEVNMELLRDGSRKRRPGFDVEDGATMIYSGVTLDPSKVLGRSQFLWENPGGIATKQFVVVQIGNLLAFHDVDNQPLSGSTEFSTTYPISIYDNIFSYASVDGNLVVATGLKQISVFQYDGVSITKSDETLLIRDLFGVAAVGPGSVVLTQPQNIQIRPTAITSQHTYNLRNQTFALPRVEGDADTQNTIDPIAEFFVASTSTMYPSNADSVIRHLVADANKASNRTVDRFNATSMFKTPPNTTKAPRGYFIIDALERGTSRLAQEALLRANNPALSLVVTSLPADTTPGGPKVLGSYAGRVWFAGFSSEVQDGDSESPRMASYILFSQLVDNVSRIPLCYQEGDPSGVDDPDVVDTDGGFIRIDGAYNIKALVNIGASLFVLAENGIWRIVGNDENTFTATSFSVFRLSDEGCISSLSVVNISDGVAYWGEYGVYIISRDQNTGDWAVTNITQESIQKFYDNILVDDRVTSVGYFDRDSPAIRWVYGPRDFTQQQQQTFELVFNTKYNVFTTNKLVSVENTYGPLSVSGNSRLTGANVVREPKESLYCIVGVFNAPTIMYTFGGYNTFTSKLDWSRGLVNPAVATGGIDSPAYIITGRVNGGDTRLRKELPYVTVYMQRSDNDPNYGMDSSCLLQSQWDWTTDSMAGKWSTPRQAYRLLRSDLGQNMVVTRNKVRGGGRAVALKFSSEPNKELHLYGWEYNIQAGSEE